VIRSIFEGLGSGALDMVQGAGYSVTLLGTVVRRAFNPRHPGREFRGLVLQMYDHGVKAIPVVTLVAVFTGMIVSLQTGIEIRAYGQEAMVGRIVAASMAREMGPFITAIILTATAGSACAAELGTMRVSEEIDALEMMSIDPVRFLVVPRVLALGLMCFALAVLTNVFGTMGGALVAKSQLGVSYRVYFDGARDTLSGTFLLGVLPKDVWTGLLKAFVFGIVIGVVGCAQGLVAKGGALGVGRAVRQSVVASIVLVLVLGYYMTRAFYAP
jgi:phospholipid/cholesterol/gamma-HCH transport system permease protein